MKKSPADKLAELEKRSAICRAYAEDMERSGYLSAARKQRRDLARIVAMAAAHRAKYGLGGAP